MVDSAGRVYLPIVTPFLDGAVDMDSYRRLLAHYVAAGIDGLIPLGTTGEGPTCRARSR